MFELHSSPLRRKAERTKQLVRFSETAFMAAGPNVVESAKAHVIIGGFPSTSQ